MIKKLNKYNARGRKAYPKIVTKEKKNICEEKRIVIEID